MATAKPFEDSGKLQKVPQAGGDTRITCLYAGVEYSPGSRLCQVKKVKICSDEGKWVDAPNAEKC